MSLSGVRTARPPNNSLECGRLVRQIKKADEPSAPQTNRYKKWSKLLETHRYNRLSLLTSAPGEVRRSWSFKTYSDCKGRYFF